VPLTGGVGTGAALIRDPVLGKKNFSESASLPSRNFPNEAADAEHHAEND
jgi:hypothetical protein